MLLVICRVLSTVLGSTVLRCARNNEVSFGKHCDQLSSDKADLNMLSLIICADSSQTLLWMREQISPVILATNKHSVATTEHGLRGVQIRQPTDVPGIQLGQVFAVAVADRLSFCRCRADSCTSQLCNQKRRSGYHVCNWIS